MDAVLKMSSVPAPPPFPALQGRKYLSLTSFRKSGQPVKTPLWFAEEDGRFFFMTRDDSWKFKRIRNNPAVKIAPCTIRGRVTGPEMAARVRIMPQSEWEIARRGLKRKYWLVRLPWLWSKHNTFLEILPT